MASHCYWRYTTWIMCWYGTGLQVKKKKHVGCSVYDSTVTFWCRIKPLTSDPSLLLGLQLYSNDLAAILLLLSRCHRDVTSHPFGYTALQFRATHRNIRCNSTSKMTTCWHGIWWLTCGRCSSLVCYLTQKHVGKCWIRKAVGHTGCNRNCPIIAPDHLQHLLCNVNVNMWQQG
jgi:hypothetical protein